MPDTTGPRSNRNPILREFRLDTMREAFPNWVGSKAGYAEHWAKKLTAVESPDEHWIEGAALLQQVFAARVLYRYAAVFGGAS